MLGQPNVFLAENALHGPAFVHNFEMGDHECGLIKIKSRFFTVLPI